MSKGRAPLQNESPRFLKSWITNLLAYPRNMSVIFKYQRKNQKTFFIKTGYMNLSGIHVIETAFISSLIQDNWVTESSECNMTNFNASLPQVINTATTTFIDCFLCARLLLNILRKHLKLITLGHSFHFWKRKSEFSAI